MDLNPTVIILAIVVLLIVVASTRRRPRPHDHDYQLRKSFISPAERSFYGVLCTAIANDYVVLAKVRVADVITPKKGQTRSSWQTAFNRISAKHFDYVLCDPESLAVKMVIELHDRSHKTTKRARRDDLLRRACKSAGLTLKEFTAKASYSVGEIRDQIQSHSSGQSTDSRSG